MFSFVNLLNDDLYILISKNLNLNDIISLKLTNNEFNNCFNDNFFNIYAFSLYTKAFWQKAEKRNPILSNPLRTMQQELLRIQNFNKILSQKGYNPWSEEEFINYWERQDKYFNKVNLK